ncbi:MAG: PKD domain-containing protein, partial [Dysgonamonadaceae bacterium]|nr:PKD domain-containing protein [Dysgonamonadaceae bacterium]
AVATINTGQSYLYTFPATANASFLEASNPVYCYQRTGVNEQGAALIPSIFSISQNAISYYQVTSETKKAFVVFRSGTDTDFNITIDGVTNSLNIGTPYTISTITGWQVARFDLPNVNEKYITISNNKSIFSLGYFAANSSSNTMTSYGYLSQFGYFSFATDTLYKCPGSSVTLDGGYALSYLWTYPDGSTATTPTITTDMPGKYILQLDQNPTNVTDSIYVTDIYFNATISQSPQSADEVPGTPVTFSVNTADMSLINNVNLTYSWTFSGCTPASSSDPTPSVTWSDPGNRNVSLTLSYTTTNGSTCDTTLTYQINPQPIEAYALCGGVPTDIYFYPDNPGYTYYWYTQNPSSGGATATTGNPFSYTKGTSSVVDTLYVQVDDGVTLSGVNKVLAYLVPDTLIWNGATDRDWLNAANWTYPGSLDYTCSDCSIYKFPGYCTNVLIPSPQSLSPLTYPDLSPAATGYTTAIDNVAACNNIHFQSGAEVVRTDSLHYSKAYVDLTLEANRWYMLSAPLGNFYVGDIYQSNPNPFLDGYFIEPMYFNAPNPQTFQTASYSWTGRFHNADELLTAGKGVAIWTDEQGTDYTDHDPVTFSFPKSDTKYYYWSDATTAVGETGALSRTNKHRFIYEPLAAGGYVPLAASPCSDTEQPVLVGNPFMAHIALDKFLDDNVGQIYDGYKLAYGVNTGSDGKVNAFSTYKKISGVWYNTDPTDPNLSYLIAPMQSFIVISRVANPVLQVNIQSTSAYTSLNDGLRSAHASSNIKKLEILATRDEERCKILLLHLPEATNAYDPEEDSYQLFPESNRQSLQIYTRSSDGYALDINALNNLSEQISLGVYTSKEGAVTLHFSGMNEFNQTGFYLHDSQENKVIDLSLQNTYTFETVAGEGAYLENRFYLTTRPNAPTVIETAAKANISINNSGRNIEILSKDADSISSIEITNLQGVHLVNEKHLSVSHYHYTVNTPGIYIVKASGKYGAEVKKIIIK